MTLLHARWVQSRLSRHLLCRIPDAGPRFALTFDDGPSPHNTPALLDLLARHGARATFFLLRGRVRRHPDVARRIAEAGHEIGVHGDLHVPAWWMPTSWVEADIRRASATIVAVTGVRPAHYRAPFGLLRPGQAAAVRRLGLVPVLGDVYPRDHDFRRPAPITGRVLARLASGSIVILHDASAVFDADRRATVDAVAQVLEAAAARGWSAAALRDLAG